MRRAAFIALSLSIGTAALAPRATGQDAPPSAAQPTGKTLDQMSVAEQLSLAQKLRDAGQLLNAQSVVKAALAKEEKNVDAHDLAGEIELDLGNAQAAKLEFLLARQIQETDFRANFGLGKVHAASKVWRQAAYYLEIAKKTMPPERSSELNRLLAETYRNVGMMKEAFAAAKEAMDADPKSFEAHQMQVALLVDGGSYDKALIENTVTLELAREQVRTAENKLGALSDLYRAYDSRVAVLQRQGTACWVKLPNGRQSDVLIKGKEREITEITKQLVEVFLVQAEMRLTISYFDTIVHAEQAARYGPEDTEALTMLARLYRNTSQFEKAARVYQKVLELDDSNVEARRELEALGAPLKPPPKADEAASQPIQIP